MKKPGILEVVTLLAVAATSASFLAFEAPEPEWKHQVVDNDTYGKFVEVETYGDTVGVAYPKSIEGGVTLAEKSYGVDVTDFSVPERSWSFETVDDRPETGMYPSMEHRSGTLYISYQDGDLGDESLHLATRGNGSWSVRELDNVSNGGVSVGMYTSLSFIDGEPVVFYHSPSQGLKLADGTSNWETRRLDEAGGWFTDTARCNGEVLAAYRAREDETLRLGSFDGESWSSENTSRSFKSDLGFDTSNCDRHFVFLNSQTEAVTYEGPNSSHEFGEEFFSRMSIDAAEDVHVVYHDEGTGAVYSSNKADEWNNRVLRESDSAGRYNDLVVDEEGNVHVAYTDGDAVRYSVYNSGTVEELERKTRRARTGLTALTVLILAFYSWRNMLLKRLLDWIRKR